MMSKKVLYIEVTSTDSDMTGMDYDEVADFTCDLMNDELGKWGLSYKPLPDSDYYSLDEIQVIITDLKSETYYKYAGVQNHTVQSSCRGVRKACNTLLKRFLKKSNILNSED